MALDIITLEKIILDQIKSVFDPEIPVNIYELGLIYELLVDEDGTVHIKMTLTAPNCPMADDIMAEVYHKVNNLHGVKEVDLKLVFDPPWDRSMMSEEAALSLGLL